MKEYIVYIYVESLGESISCNLITRGELGNVAEFSQKLIDLFSDALPPGLKDTNLSIKEKG